MRDPSPIVALGATTAVACGKVRRVRWPALAKLRTALLYAIGSIAASWSLLRIVAIAG